jgi:hypothetical protein
VCLDLVEAELAKLLGAPTKDVTTVRPRAGGTRPEAKNQDESRKLRQVPAGTTGLRLPRLYGGIS